MVATMEPKTMELSIEKPKYFFRPFYTASRERARTVFNPRLPQRVIVVGCGGNGGYLIPLIARYIATSPSEFIRDIELVLIDGDVVEEKNILRQNFVQSDIGNKKSETLADRCNMAFGMNIRAIPNHLNSGVLDREWANYGTLVIGCVDRHEVRHLISQKIERHYAGYNSGYSAFYIDVGNELTAGHLFMSGPLSIRMNEDGFEKRTAPILIHKFFPKIAEADIKKAEPSCADLTASGAQRMDVNVKAATLAFEAFCAVMAPGEIDYYELSFGPGRVRTFLIKDLTINRVGIPSKSKEQD